MDLKTRVRKFLECSEINKTKFCKNVNISITTLNLWLKGERDLSTKIEERMVTFMAEFTKNLVDISA